MKNKAMSLFLLTILLALLMCGCGCKAPQTNAGNPAPPNSTTAASQTANQPLLPSWAPKNPSPEFLHAAKVLRPMPETEEPANDPLNQALIAKQNRVSVPAWEFFGLLSDQEVSRLFASKNLRMYYKSMSSKQQAAFKRYLEVWRETYKGLGSTEYQGGLTEDHLVDLYKRGAKEDLSNVLFEFQVRGNHLVRAFIYVVQSDGSLSMGVNMVFGYS